MAADHKRYKRALVGLILAGFALLTLLPFFMTLVMSQKTNGEILNQFWSLPEQLRPEYYVNAFTFLGVYIGNTVLVGCGTIFGVVFLSSLAGYVFARIDFAGKKVVFLLILALMMIPGILTLIPAFIWYKEFPKSGRQRLAGPRWDGVSQYALGAADPLYRQRPSIRHLSLPQFLREPARIAL